MTNVLLIGILLLVAVSVALQVFVLCRKVEIDLSGIDVLRQEVEKGFERTERSVREEIAKNREEASAAARQSREEIAGTLKAVGDTLNKQMVITSQNSDQKLERVRETVEKRLQIIQADNAGQLEKMRATVDEKLQGTLEKRLGESFKLVNERLAEVYKGLGEMRTLAVGVGDLKKVLTNVKTRGTWGEVQLGAMLEQVLSPDQYASNVAVKPGGERVEFAIKLPGRGENREEVVWLPIDAKFPVEDYQRLIEAQENADPQAAENAARQLEVRIKQCARAICDKYIVPPRTTDFGILFLPTEGLFAEVIRRAGLAEFVQRECRVVIAGPTTLWSILNSLQMGFRTLAIEQRSSEVWRVLGAVKTEFTKFGDLLTGVKNKLDQASNSMEDAVRKSRTIERKLRTVQELPAAEAAPLLAYDSSTSESADSETDV